MLGSHANHNPNSSTPTPARAELRPESSLGNGGPLSELSLNGIRNRIAVEPPNCNGSNPAHYCALDNGFVDLKISDSVHVLGDWGNNENRQSVKVTSIFGIAPNAIASDKDGTVYDSEPAQQISWHNSVRQITREHLSKASPRDFHQDHDLLHRQTMLVSDRVIEAAFASGNFSNMMIGLFEKLRDANHLPEGVDTPDKLDHELSRVRGIHIIDAFQSGLATVIPGVKRCLGGAADIGLPVAFYTNTERSLAELMLVHVFGEKFVDDVAKALICREDVPREHLKPSAYGWALVAHRVGLLNKIPEYGLKNLTSRDYRRLQTMIIMEDRIPAIINALEKGLGGGAILVAPKPQARDEAIQKLSTWSGKKILIVPNLRPIDFVPPT